MLVHITIRENNENKAPACSSLISEQNGVLIRYFDPIFVMYSFTEWNNIVLTGKPPPQAAPALPLQFNRIITGCRIVSYDEMVTKCFLRL